MPEIFQPIESTKKQIYRKGKISGIAIGIIVGGIIASVVGFFIYHPLVITISIK